MTTTSQIRYLHYLLRETNLIEQKAIVINHLTGGRTDSARELLPDEANTLIRYLQCRLPVDNKTASANQMRRKIISAFHKMGWEKSPGIIDMGRINSWCTTKSYLKKQLQDYTAEELPNLVSQVYLVYKYHIDQTFNF